MTNRPTLACLFEVTTKFLNIGMKNAYKGKFHTKEVGTKFAWEQPKKLA